MMVVGESTRSKSITSKSGARTVYFSPDSFNRREIPRFWENWITVYDNLIIYTPPTHYDDFVLVSSFFRLACRIREWPWLILSLLKKSQCKYYWDILFGSIKNHASHMQNFPLGQTQSKSAYSWLQIFGDPWTRLSHLRRSLTAFVFILAGWGTFLFVVKYIYCRSTVATRIIFMVTKRHKLLGHFMRFLSLVF